MDESVHDFARKAADAITRRMQTPDPIGVGDRVKIRSVKPTHEQPKKWLGVEGTVSWVTEERGRTFAAVELDIGEKALVERHQLWQ